MVLWTRSNRFGVADAVCDQRDRFPPQGVLQAFADEAGQVSINGGPFNPAAFGRLKQSGRRRELGRFGLEEFLTYIPLPVPAR